MSPDWSDAVLLKLAINHINKACQKLERMIRKHRSSMTERAGNIRRD